MQMDKGKEIVPPLAKDKEVVPPLDKGKEVVPPLEDDVVVQDPRWQVKELWALP